MNHPGTDPVFPADPHARAIWSWQRSGVLAIFFILFVVVLIGFYEQLTLERLSEHEIELRRLGTEYPVIAYVVAFAIYVLITGLSIPGSSALSLLYGWYFPFWGAVILVSFSATTGATVAFLVSRYLFHDAVQVRFGRRLKTVNAALEQEGAYYLFALRLMPVVPYFIINAVMGLTPLKTSTFWWVSQLGMLPGTIVYIYAGSSAPSLAVLAEKGIAGVPFAEMLLAFVLLACFPFVARWLVKFASSR